MQYSSALSDALLALACLAGLVELGRGWRRAPRTAQPALLAALLGFALTAAAAGGGVVHYGHDPGWSAAHQWLSRASSLLGLPLIAASALSLSLGRGDRLAHWLGLTLSLGALFVLAYWLKLGAIIGLALNLISLALLLAAGRRQTPQRTPLLAAGLVVGLFLLAGLGIGSQGLIGPWQRVDLFHVLLSAAYPLLAWLILAMPSTQSAEKTVKTL